MIWQGKEILQSGNSGRAPRIAHDHFHIAGEFHERLTADAAWRACIGTRTDDGYAFESFLPIGHRLEQRNAFGTASRRIALDIATRVDLAPNRLQRCAHEKFGIGRIGVLSRCSRARKDFALSGRQ